MSELLRYSTKEDVSKNRFILDYVMLIAFGSQVKFSKKKKVLQNCFSGVKFHAKFEACTLNI